MGDRYKNGNPSGSNQTASAVPGVLCGKIENDQTAECAENRGVGEFEC